ncbi:MAG: hypothetical protein J6R48_08855 [Muribaculaceae bacterium]|nr:hypothetical protein [Muribaculaceae bacterium]
MIKRVADNLSLFTASIASLLKVMLLSKRVASSRPVDKSRRVIVLGNGPSLRTTIADHLDFLMSHDRIAVNFAANAPEFFELQPTGYVLADPHFFDGISTDPNVAKLWDNIRSTRWPMTLFLPANRKEFVTEMRLSDIPHLTISYYNLTPVEGCKSLSHRLFNLGLGMPRPRNVLIPSIMLAIREGYGTIYIAGADHSWTRTLWVDEDNRVVSIQPHFYQDNEEEKKRVATEYHNYPLHQILQSLYIAFRSYFDIADYAKTKGIDILNITPDSFIDAFPRLRL